MILRLYIYTLYTFATASDLSLLNVIEAIEPLEKFLVSMRSILEVFSLIFIKKYTINIGSYD